MSAEPFSHVVILDPRPLIAEPLKRALRHKRWLESIHTAGSPDVAIRLLLRKRSPLDGPRKHLFVIGSFSYLELQPILGRMAVCFPSSKIILLDDRVRFGCVSVVFRHTVHGYVTLHDSVESCCECVRHVAENKAGLTPLAENLLRIDSSRHVLACHGGLEQQPPLSLSEEEWRCFQQCCRETTTPCREANELTRARMMEKLQVGSENELLRVVQRWGFLG